MLLFLSQMDRKFAIYHPYILILLKLINFIYLILKYNLNLVYIYIFNIIENKFNYNIYYMTYYIVKIF